MGNAPLGTWSLLVEVCNRVSVITLTSCATTGSYAAPRRTTKHATGQQRRHGDRHPSLGVSVAQVGRGRVCGQFSGGHHILWLVHHHLQGIQGAGEHLVAAAGCNRRQPQSLDIPVQWRCGVSRLCLCASAPGHCLVHHPILLQLQVCGTPKPRRVQALPASRVLVHRPACAQHRTAIPQLHPSDEQPAGRADAQRAPDLQHAPPGCCRGLWLHQRHPERPVWRAVVVVDRPA
ncbi:hypothetical protein HaLaN_01494 [Haematococcus lacustris]|uniref:Uncharacterized protein n=1 Tax=Haematococcus lacustris TaxID=44745 RepID=A0A699YIH7_HAELA|nr:hypothetical protein HaLaN_01494 [Haematococcus lacustris]